MKQQIQAVQAFHTATHSHQSSFPTIDVSDATKQSRIRLMTEELHEVVQAIESEPIDHVAKELADLLYTLLGTVEAFGLSEVFEEVFAAVHESNMSKVTGKTIIMNEQGKVMKPATYTAPDIRAILEKTL